MRSDGSSDIGDDSRIQETIVLGEVTAASGLKGDIRIRSFTRPDTEIFEYNQWILSDTPRVRSAWLKNSLGGESPGQVFKLLGGKRSGKHLVASLSGIDDRDRAEALIGLSVVINREQLPRAKDGEYYWDDLIGLRVSNTTGADFGIVDHLVETGANDVLVVKGELGDVVEERLIPWIDDVVVSVDLDKGMLTVDWEEHY